MVSFDANMHGNRNIFVNIQYFLIATAYKTIYIFCPHRGKKLCEDNN